MNTQDSLKILNKCKPVYKSLKGWKKSTKGIKDKDKLPKEVFEFFRTIEEEVETPIIMASTGPERTEYVYL